MIMDYDFPRRRPPWPHRRPTLSTPLPLHLPRQCLPHIFICRPHGPLASTSTCLPLLSLTISWPSCSYPAERQRLLIYEFPTCFTTPVTTMSACCCCTDRGNASLQVLLLYEAITDELRSSALTKARHQCTLRCLVLLF
jgi:hypothetical protein